MQKIVSETGGSRRSNHGHHGLPSPVLKKKGKVIDLFPCPVSTGINAASAAYAQIMINSDDLILNAHADLHGTDVNTLMAADTVFFYDSYNWTVGHGRLSLFSMRADNIKRINIILQRKIALFQQYKSAPCQRACYQRLTALI